MRSISSFQPAFSAMRHVAVGVDARIAGVGQQFGSRPLLNVVDEPFYDADSLRSVVPSSTLWPVVSRVMCIFGIVLAEMPKRHIHILRCDFDGSADEPDTLGGQQGAASRCHRKDRTPK